MHATDPYFYTTYELRELPRDQEEVRSVSSLFFDPESTKFPTALLILLDQEWWCQTMFLGLFEIFLEGSKGHKCINISD